MLVIFSMGYDLERKLCPFLTTFV